MSPEWPEYARRELRRRTHPSVIESDLVARGATSIQAQICIDMAQSDLDAQRLTRTAVSANPARRRQLWTGIAMIVAGLAIYLVTFLLTGGSFMMIMWGFMLVGALRIAQSLSGHDGD